MQKKAVFWVILLAFVTGILPSVGAAGSGIYLNGDELTFTPPPVLHGGSFLVPLRPFFTALGAAAEWDEATQTVRGSCAGTHVLLTVDKSEAFVDAAPVPLSAVPRLIDGHVYIPLRFVSEAFGYRVAWSGQAVSLERAEPVFAVCTVLRVLDGDTFEVLWRGKREKIDLSGVAAPGTVYQAAGKDGYGEAAYAFTRLSLTNQPVRLEFAAPARDAAGVLRADVYLADGTFFNAALVEQGWAEAAAPPEARHGALLASSQQKAQGIKCGIWAVEPESVSAAMSRPSPPAPDPVPPPRDNVPGEDAADEIEGVLVGNSSSKKFHKPGCASAKRIKAENRVSFPSRAEAEAAGYVPCQNCKP